MISNSAKIAKDVADSPYAWPGGYPRLAITDDGGCLCPKCCKAESANIADSAPGDGWHIVAADINWEDPDLYCDHCGNRIESAYAEDTRPQSGQS